MYRLINGIISAVLSCVIALVIYYFLIGGFPDLAIQLFVMNGINELTCLGIIAVIGFVLGVVYGPADKIVWPN